MSNRARATATISFGLVTIPVKVYTSVESIGTSFNLISKDGNRVQQKLVDAVTGAEVNRAECLKGFEYAKDQFVTFTPEEIASLSSTADKTMAITEFVDADSIEPRFIEKVCYLGPDKGGDKGYSLLAQTMKAMKQVGVAQWTSQGRDHLVVIAPFQDGLALYQCFYKDEVRDFEVDVATMTMSKPEEVVAGQLVSMLATGAFDPSKYHDRYAKRVQDAVDQKIAGKEIAVVVETAKTSVLDLYEALKASLKVKASS